MSMPDSIRRHCPACACEATEVVIASIDFASPSLQRHFTEFYPPAVQNLIRQTTLDPGEIRRCQACRTHFHGRLPPDDFLRQLYTQLNASPAKETEVIQTHIIEQRVLELTMVVRFLSARSTRPSVLDFGTGDGSWAILAAAIGCEVTATDTAEAVFARLQPHGIACMSAAKLPSGCFDFINTEQVFEHLPDPCAVVRQLAHSLRRGGVLKIGVPCDPELATKLRTPDWTTPKNQPASLNSLEPFQHLNAFTPTGLEHLARLAGLTPLSVSGFTLHDPRQRQHSSLRGWLIRRLRDRLGQRHGPPYTLAQTRFFLRPA